MRVQQTMALVVGGRTASSMYAQRRPPRPRPIPLDRDMLEMLPDGLREVVLARMAGRRVRAYLLPGDSLVVEIRNAR